jgi:anti-anti-sigma factor
MSALGVTSTTPARPPATTVGPASFSITEELERGQTFLRARGELDLAAVPELRAGVWSTARRDGMAILDLSGIVFIDVAGLSALTALTREARKGHWVLELRHAPLVVRQLARLTGLHRELLANR